ncbi:unnamed protein product [Alopecurus aequalis]
MGNSRPGGRPGGAGGSSSTGREDAGCASGGPPTPPAPAARSGANEAVMNTRRLPSRGGSGEPGPRRSGRNAPAPCQERGSAGPGNVMRPCSVRQQNGDTASNSLSRDSDRSAGSTKGREELMSQNASSSPKKRKRLTSRSYLKRFKPVQGANATATDVVVASPDRVGKENTASGHVADCKISKLCEGSRVIKKNKKHSSDAACKVSKENKKECCLSSLQSVPTSLIHHEEIKSTLGDSEPISVQKEDSASGHVKVTPSDETDGNSNICVACGTPGTLRSCDGKACQSRYHISCLDPSLKYLSSGIWFCTSCTKKRFQFGLHTIVDGIDSVWDVKKAEGMQNSKQYFVKYKNLAHVHNCWVPEDDINVMPGGPDLLSLFNKMNHTEKAIWKEEWTQPHRLLRKRLLMPPKLADDFFSSSGVKYSYCNLEWLVKWRGLGYDHATWELETLPCLCTPEADELKKNYENRREAAKQSSIPTKAKVKQRSFQKLQRLPDGCHPDFDNDHLCSVNHLREFWYKSCGAVLVDDKEYIIKTVLFTMSVLPDVSQPILIVTTPASLSLWEAQFNNLAPFINVVVYDGGKDELKLIQDLEFYESGGCIMLQVLLSHADAILEDIESISRISWEAVIVDYYQKSTLQYLEQLKQLSTDFRMLLVSSPVKDNLPEYVKLLGFLGSEEQEDGRCIDTADALVMSEVNFKRHIAYERRADSSTILEHWVPAYISQLQLEIYCSILVSNSSVLQSQMKSDSSPRDIIMSLSKCCDHPYLVDDFLQKSPVDNHDHADTIDTRVQACGKLLLLQKMLKEIRNRRLRVIILFQSGVAGGNPVGDILEGVLCDRFGPESYARVERRAPLAKKHAAINMFNDKTKGRFVSLIESRACLPSIKLSSVDAIIIYNSDCNPLNDLKALQRIKIESQSKYPGIFRLYTPFTMEEKQLVLAKHGVLIDNYKDMQDSSVHSLISWGASFLFTRLDELQHDNYASKSFESDTYFMDKVILEFLKKLATNFEDSTEISCSLISKANMSGEFYSRRITLIGEKQGDAATSHHLGDVRMQVQEKIDRNLGADPVFPESPTYPTNSPVTLQVSTEIESQICESSMDAKQSTSPPTQQSLAISWRPPAEAEQSGILGTEAAWDLQPEVQASISMQDQPTEAEQAAVLQRVRPSLDPHTGVESAGIVIAHDPQSEIQPSASECAEQSTSLPAQKVLATSQRQPPEVEPPGILGTEAACNLQPEIQSSTSMEDEPAEAEVQPEAADAERALASQDLQPDVQSSTSVQDVPFERTYLSDMPVLQSPTIHQIVEHSLDPHAGVEPVGMVTAHDLQPEIQPSALVPAEQSTSLPAQKILAPSQRQPPEAEPPGILGTEAACNLQPEIQSSTSMADEPAESEVQPEAEDESEAADEPAEAERALASQDLQPDVQSSTSVQDVPFERTYLSGMPVLQSPTIHQTVEHSLYPHAGVEPVGMVTAHDLQPEIQLSASMQDEPAEAEVQPEAEDEPMVPEVEDEPEAEDEPAEAERAGTLGTITAEDLRPEMQSSTSTQVVPFEQNYCMSVLQSPTIRQRVEPLLDPHAGVESAGTVITHDLESEILRSASVPKEQSTCLPAQLSLVTSRHSPAEAGPADILGTEFAFNLQHSQGEMQPSTTMQDQPSTSVQDEPAEAEDETEAKDEPEVPGVEDEPEIEDEPADELAEVERAGTLGAIAAEDLQPEMQSSTSAQVVPLERTYCMSVLQSPTIRQRVEPLLDPLAGVESAGTVTTHDLQSEILPSASVPMEQSTSLPAQLSSETSLHSPAEAGPTDILGTESPCDLQPSQDEMQPSTTMQDACILGAIAARRLQPETQPSTSRQFERTHLVGMPVLQSLTLHRSVEPSLDPHARAESTHTLDSLIACDLQSEVQPSASMQDRPSEAEGAVMVGSTAAQDLQPELQSSTTVQHVPLERIHSEERRQIGFQPNMSPEQPTQRPPVTALVFNNPMISDEPLKNELDRLMHCNNVLSKDHDHKKSQLLIEYEQEIEKITTKYDLLLQKEDSTCLQFQEELTDIYRKVLVNQSLAENFRGVFRSSSAAQGRSMSPVIEQPVGSSSAARTTASPVVSSSAIRPPVYNPPGYYVRPSFVTQSSSSSSSWNAQPQTIVPGNLYGTTSSPSVPAPVPYGSYGSAGAQSRAVQPQSASPRTMSQLCASAPHLQHLRMPLPYAVHTDQQQLPVASPGVTQFGQYVPVIVGSYASAVPSSVHRAMLPSASNSRPPRPAPLLPSGRQELMVNLQSSSPNPAFFPALQSSYQNIALGSISGPPNATPGSQQHAGAQIAGVNRPGFESTSLNAYMPARFGLGSSSSPAGAGAASAQVVCLSDDES